MNNSTCCNNSKGCRDLPNYNAKQECNSVMIPFTATVMIPADFDYNCTTQIAMSLSTENLVVYKELVEYVAVIRDCKREECDLTRNQICNGNNSCKPIVKQCNNYIITEIGEVRIGGILKYRIAVNGVQSDPLIIDTSIKDIVNVDDDIWSSGDGYIGISDGCNSYITIGYIPPDKDIDMISLKVCLKSLNLVSVCKEKCSTDLRLTLKGKVLIKYTLPT